MLCNQGRNPTTITENKTILALRDTKTSNSRRIIPLFDSLKERLIAYKKDQIKLKSKNGKVPKEDDFVFQSTAFKMYDPERFYGKYQQLLEDANIKGADFHFLGHTFATRSLEQGMDIRVLS